MILSFCLSAVSLKCIFAGNSCWKWMKFQHNVFLYGVFIWSSRVVDPDLITSLQRANLIAYRLVITIIIQCIQCRIFSNLAAPAIFFQTFPAVFLPCRCTGCFCPIHSADADATQLSSWVASAVWTQFATSSRRLPTDSVDNLETDQRDSIAVWLRVNCDRCW